MFQLSTRHTRHRFKQTPETTLQKPLNIYIGCYSNTGQGVKFCVSPDEKQLLSLNGFRFSRSIKYLLNGTNMQSFNCLKKLERRRSCRVLILGKDMLVIKMWWGSLWLESQPSTSVPPTLLDPEFVISLWLCTSYLPFSLLLHLLDHIIHNLCKRKNEDHQEF